MEELNIVDALEHILRTSVQIKLCRPAYLIQDDIAQLATKVPSSTPWKLFQGALINWSRRLEDVDSPYAAEAFVMEYRSLLGLLMDTLHKELQLQRDRETEDFIIAHHPLSE